MKNVSNSAHSWKMHIIHYFFLLFLVRCRGMSVVVPNSPLVADPGTGC